MWLLHAGGGNAPCCRGLHLALVCHSLHSHGALHLPFVHRTQGRAEISGKYACSAPCRQLALYWEAATDSMPCQHGDRAGLAHHNERPVVCLRCPGHAVKGGAVT